MHSQPLRELLSPLQTRTGSFFSKNGFVTIAWILLYQNAFSQITLVKDINSYAADVGSNPSHLVAMGGMLFFSATSENAGIELFVSKGTDASTQFIDLVSNGSSSPDEITSGDGVVFFSGNTDSSGRELWVSDGTEAGTRFIDIDPGPGGSYPSSLAFINGKLFFSATDGIHGTEFWVSDGTKTGTNQVADINSGPESSSPEAFIAFHDNLFFFTAFTTSRGRELWISDGTQAGTHMVKDITGNNQNGIRSGLHANIDLITYKGFLYFPGNDGQNGTELWRSDGTSNGTLLFKDFYAGNNGEGNPDNMVIFNSLLLFSANSDTTGTELFRTDGTSEGTLLVKNIKPGTASGVDTYGLVANSRGIFFRANDGSHGDELWKSDGTAAGTMMVKDLLRPGSSSPQSFMVINDLVYFIAQHDEYNYVAWRSDGTAEGTQPIQDGHGDIPSSTAQFTQLKAAVYFTGDTHFGMELMRINAEGKSTMVKDILSAPSSSSPSYLRVVNGKLFFSATPFNGSPVDFYVDSFDNVTQRTTTFAQAIYTYGAPFGNRFIVNYTIPGLGSEPCLTNGKSISLLKDLNPGPGSSDPDEFFPINKGFLFVANDSVINHSHLFMTDGTFAGTKKIESIQSPDDPYNPGNFTILNDEVLFSGTSNSGTELWKTDGTEAGTVQVKDIWPGANGSSPGILGVLGNDVLFGASNGIIGVELWKSDGTEAGTVLVKDLSPLTSYSLVYYDEPYLVWNSNLYFTATDGTNGFELFKTDGTKEGTVMVKDIWPGSNSSDPRKYFIFKNQLYFFASKNFDNDGLYRTDGTDTGTVLIKSVGIFTSIPQHQVVIAGDHFYFNAVDGQYGEELWQSDGTAKGTFIVQDLYPGIASSAPEYITLFNNALYFAATDSGHSRELFKYTLPVSKIQDAAVEAVPISVSAWPNPFFDQASINIISEQKDVPCTVIISDIMGREVEKERGTSSSSFRVGSKLPAGMYIAAIRSGSQLKTLKLIKVKE